MMSLSDSDDDSIKELELPPKPPPITIELDIESSVILNVTPALKQEVLTAENNNIFRTPLTPVQDLLKTPLPKDTVEPVTKVKCPYCGLLVKSSVFSCNRCNKKLLGKVSKQQKVNEISRVPEKHSPKFSRKTHARESTPLTPIHDQQQPPDQSSPYHWSPDMLKFYNDEENDEIFDVRALQSRMDCNSRLWDVGEVRNVRPMYGRSGKSCFNCGRRGDDERNCPCRRYCCSMCGADGHARHNCPRAMCLLCGKGRMRQYVPACNPCRAKYKKVCPRCHRKGHALIDCTEHWRRFHHVTTLGVVMPPTQPVYKPKSQQWCSNCAKKGHLNADCPQSRDAQRPIDSSVVTSYHKEFAGDRADLMGTMGSDIMATPILPPTHHNVNYPGEKRKLPNQIESKTPDQPPPAKKTRYFEGVAEMETQSANRPANLDRTQTPKRPRYFEAVPNMIPFNEVAVTDTWVKCNNTAKTIEDGASYIPMSTASPLQPNVVDTSSKGSKKSRHYGDVQTPNQERKKPRYFGTSASPSTSGGPSSGFRNNKRNSNAHLSPESSAKLTKNQRRRQQARQSTQRQSTAVSSNNGPLGLPTNNPGIFIVEERLNLTSSRDEKMRKQANNKTRKRKLSRQRRREREEASQPVNHSNVNKAKKKAKNPPQGHGLSNRISQGSSARSVMVRLQN